MTRPSLIDLNLDEHNQGLRYYSFVIKLDRYNGTCNTLDFSSGWIFAANEKEDLNLDVFDKLRNVNHKS